MFTDLLIAMFDSGLTSLGTETIDVRKLSWCALEHCLTAQLVKVWTPVVVINAGNARFILKGCLTSHIRAN